MSEKDLYQLFENVILHRDSEDLLNFLSSEESSTNDVNVVITYLGNCFDDCLNCLPEREITITNALSFLGDFIQVVSLDVDQSAFLSKCMIQLAAQEDCIIQIIKRVVYTLNMLLSSEKVGALLIKDETLDGPIQIFGRRISFIGDYECQALILESLYRLGADKSSKTYWTNVWFQSNKLRSMFLNLNPQQFEMDCRNILNHINREEFSQRIYSFVAISAFFGHSQLKKPNGSEFWFDFNYDSQSISFYCCEFSDENNENSAWETIVIPIDIIKNYTVSDLTTLKIKEIILYLNCSCNDLAPDDSKSEIFESNEVKIRYWSCLDVSKHLKKLFGNDELSSNEKLNGPERKVSENSNIFKNNEEKETTSQRSRKVSEIKSFVKMDELDTQKVENPSKSKRKISETGLLIKEHFDEDIKNHAESRRKISEVCDLINDSAEETILIEKNKKISEVNELLNSDNNTQKENSIESNIFNSTKEDDSQFISPTLYEKKTIVLNNIQNKIIKNSTSCENLNLTENSILNNSQCGNTKHNIHRMSTKKTDKKSENIEKGRKTAEKVPLKRVRLYNLDSAPMYDRPPSTKNNLAATNNLCKESATILNNTQDIVSTDANIKLPVEKFDDDDDFCDQSSLDSKNLKRIRNAEIKCMTSKMKTASQLIQVIPNSEPTELHRFQEIKLTPVHDLKETNLDQEAQKSDAEKTLPTGEYHNLTDKKNSIEDSRKMSVEEIGEKLYSTGHIKSSDEDLIPFEKPSNERVEEIVDEPYLNGHFDNSDEDFIPQTEPPSKKPRKAAVRATKKNKLILEQKESEKDSTCTCEDPKIKSDIMNNKKQNHIISQKRKKNGPSSQADGETGSSEVSWYKRAKYGLFHTPPMKNYSKKSLRKQKQIKDKEVKRNYRKSCKLKRQKKGNALGNKSTDSESKSRSMKLSDIENYSLIIESKNESKISRKTARESNFQSDLLNSINEMLPSSQTQHNVNDEDFNNYCLTEKSFEDSVLGSETFEDVRNHNKSDIEHNSNHAKVRNVKKRIRKHVQSATDFIHPILSCDKDALLYSTNSYVNHEEQKSKIRHVNSDNVEKSNIYEENNKVFSNKTSKLEDNVPKLKTKDCHSKIAKVSKKRSETLPAKNKEKRFKNIPISEETLVELSPVFNSKPQISENLFSNSLSSKNSSSNVERVQENVCINLSFESLGSLPDEKNGKELHMQKFLESLSGDSPTQIDVEVYSVASAASLKRVHEDCLSKNDIPHKKYKTDSSDLEEKELKSKLSVSTSNDIEVDGSYNFKNQFIESNTLSSIKSEILCSTKLNALSTCPDSNIIYLEKQKYFPKSSPIHNFKSEKLVQKPTKKRQHFTKGSLKNFDIDMKSCDSKQKRNVSHFKKYPIRDNLSLLKEKKMTAGTIFTILASEINSLTKMLCGTLQKYAVEFSTKITALRKNMVKTMERMISCNPDFNKKNLRNLAQSCKENRLQIQEDVNKLLEIGKEYFEAERENERKLKRLHKKIAYKYAFNAKIVEKVAVKSVEEKIIMKTRSVFKKLLRNMEKL